MDYDYKFKIVTVGDTGVGKTSLLNVNIDGNYTWIVTYLLLVLNIELL